jgi:small subunit ribosomal protein S6
MYFRRYETLILLSPHLSTEQLAGMKTKIEDIITKGNGQIVRFEERGRQKLAYPVRKELYGYYVLYDFRAQAALAAELERNLKIDEKVFKYLTLVQDKHFSEESYQAVLEQIANEASRREKEREQSQAAAEAALDAPSSEAYSEDEDDVDVGAYDETADELGDPADNPADADN